MDRLDEICADPLGELAPIVSSKLANRGLLIVACIRDGNRALDFATQSPSGRFSVLRLVRQPHEADFRAVGAMVAQGDFTQAAIVSLEHSRPTIVDEIRVWPFGKLDELAEVLAKEVRL